MQKNFSFNKIFIITVITLLMIFLLIVGYILGSFKSRQPFVTNINTPTIEIPTTFITPTTMFLTPTLQTIKNFVDVNKEEKSMLFPSLTNEYFFYFYPQSGSVNKCDYYIRDYQGKILDISDLIGIKVISCGEGMIGYYTDMFKGWIERNKFLFIDKPGEIKIIDIPNHTISSYEFDNNLYKFVLVNKSLEYWLFTKKTTTEKKEVRDYVLLDKNKNVINDNIHMAIMGKNNYSLFMVLYDYVNDGFLFISRYYTDKLLRVKFEFISVTDLKLKSVLVTDPVEWYGRGCSGTSIASEKPGEIIVAGDCLIVDKKYKGVDGAIHIMLYND